MNSKRIDILRAEKARPGVAETPLYLLHEIFPDVTRKRCWHRPRTFRDVARLRLAVTDIAKWLWLALIPEPARTIDPAYPIFSSAVIDSFDIRLCHGYQGLHETKLLMTMICESLNVCLVAARSKYPGDVIVGYPEIKAHYGGGSSATVHISVPYKRRSPL